MTVRSYLAFAAPGKGRSLAQELRCFPFTVKATPAEGADLVVLVTETLTGDEEQAMERDLDGIPFLQGLTLVFGEVPELDQTAYLDRDIGG